MKTIAWDVDDVLNNLMQEWLEWFKKINDIKINFEELTENPPDKILGISLSEYQKSLDEFRLSENYQKMEPVGAVLDWFKKHGHDFRHIALTSTPLNTASTTAQWVFRNFGNWIRTFHFVPSKRDNIVTPDYERDKSDFFRWFDKVDVFIDDNLENINKAEQVGIRVMLWKRPWNNADKTWQEILDELKY